MKGKLSQVYRSGLAMFMAVIMVFSCTPMSAFAAEVTKASGKGFDLNGDGAVNYVSFGDSVTNGYGMDGYRYTDGTNVLGFRREVAGSYPVEIAKYLKEESGLPVKLDQMAISGFRMDELHWMLCDDYKPDYYHNDYFANWNRRCFANLSESTDPEALNDLAYFTEKYEKDYGVIDEDITTAKADKILMAEYREAVKNADFITIDLGTNNFGTFLTSTISSILVTGQIDTKEVNDKTQFSHYMDAQSAATLEGIIDQMAAGMAESNSGTKFDLIRTLARCMMFGYLGFINNYDGALDAIYKINPNVEVLVIDMYSMILGVELNGEKLGDVDLDELYNMFVDMANFYANELSPYAQKVTHASIEIGNDPRLLIDDYAEYFYPNNQGALVAIPQRDANGDMIYQKDANGNVLLDDTGNPIPVINEDYNPTAVTLLHEFIMESTKGADGNMLDPDVPADREEFNQKIGNNVKLLDTYVYDLQGVIRDMVVREQILPGINGSIQPIEMAIDALDLIYMAIEGVAAARAGATLAVEKVPTAIEAVDTAIAGVKTAEEAVDAAVSGVALANHIVDLLVEKLINLNELGGLIKFEGYETSDFVKSEALKTIEGYITDDIMRQAGFEPTESNKKLLAEEAYEMGCVYYEHKSDPAVARKMAVLEGLSFMLEKTQGLSASEAEAKANTAYELNAVHTAQGRPAAVKAALATVVGAETAEQAYQVNELYKAQGRDAAIVAAINTVVGDQKKSELAYNLYKVYQANGGADNHEAAYNAAVLAAVESELPEDAVTGFGMTKAEAAGLAVKVADSYNTQVNAGLTEKEAVVNCLITVAKDMLGMTIEQTTAETGYDLYHGVYKLHITNGSSKEEAKKQTVLYALKTNFASMGEVAAEAVADAMYAVYKNTANAEQEKLAYITAMQVAGIPAETAAAIYTCYATNLNGHYEDANVKAAILYFMTVALKVDEATANGLYGSYIQYKNVALTLAKISRLNTVFFDTLLTGAIDLSLVAKGIQNGTLVLEDPGKDSPLYEDFMRDSSLAIFYFRFMAADGVFTHPSIDGHATFTEVIKNALANKVPAPTADSDIIITNETSILSIGDAMVAADKEGNYTELIANKLGLSDKVTYVQNDMARLEDFYHALVNETGDMYAQKVVTQAGGIDGAALKEQIKANDIILINAGSMNLGYSALQIATYQSTDGSTYAMKFADMENMSVRDLGERVDTFLTKFQGSTGVTQSASAAGMIMLLFESYGYGLTSYTNAFNNLMDEIHTLNPDATIVLTGIGDIAGDSYYATFAEDGTPTAYLGLGNFYQRGADLLNGHMEKYAAQTANIFYMDTMDAENPATQRTVPLNVAADTSALGGLLNDAHFTTKGHETVASKFDCENFGVHFVKDNSKEATCTDAGKIEQLCVICKESESTTVPALGHSYEAPEWNWDGFESATATFTCTRANCGHKETVEAEITKETVDSDCVNGGKTVYTATAYLDKTPYYNEKTDPITAKGHIYGQPVWTWNAELTEATATFTCTRESCNGTAIEKASGDAIVEHITKDATCTVAGTKDLTATIIFEDVTYTDTKTDVVIPATNVHNYVDGECTMCKDVEHKVDCTYKEETALKAGELTLALGGTEVGAYTFEQVSGGWTIKGTNGYLALADGALTTSSTPFTWTYANGMFSATETKQTTSSNNNWWNNILGGILGGIIGGGNNTTTTTTTYYLAVSGATLTVSTDTTGAAATFYVKHNDGNANHNYVEKVVEVTCTTDGYTEYTCTKCGTSYKKNVVKTNGHDYEAKVTAPTCTAPGYTEYTCKNGCGDTYRSDETPATNHNFVDGTCTACGEAEEGECVGTKETSLTSGLTAQLTLNGANIGTFTFTQVDGGWTIRANDGRYLAKEGAYSNEPFVWTFSNNSFSYVVETTSSSNNNWLGNILGGLLGGILGGGSTTTKTTYYLVAANGAPAVSTNAATAKFLVVSTGDHVYGNPVSKDGKHVFTCTVCGNVKETVCTDENCPLCHPVIPEEPETPEVPEANVNVSVNVTSSSSSSGNWFENLFGGIFGSSSKKTYTATINVSAEGTDVKKVEYSTDGTNWNEGTSFTSDSNITKFYIRVTGTNNVVYEFTYNNGNVTAGLPGQETPDTPPVIPDEPETEEPDDDNNSSSGNWWENIFGGFGNWFK